MVYKLKNIARYKRTYDVLYNGGNIVKCRTKKFEEHKRGNMPSHAKEYGVVYNVKEYSEVLEKI